MVGRKTWQMLGLGFLGGVMFCQPKPIFLFWIPKTFKEWGLCQTTLSPVPRGCSFPAAWYSWESRDPIKTSCSPRGDKSSPFHRKGPQGQQTHSSLFFFQGKQPAGTAQNFWVRVKNGGSVSLLFSKKLVLPNTEEKTVFARGGLTQKTFQEKRTRDTKNKQSLFSSRSGP